MTSEESIIKRRNIKDKDISIDSLIFKRGCYKDKTPCLEIKLTFPSAVNGSSKKFCNSILSDYLTQIYAKQECNSMDEFKTALLNFAYSLDSSYTQYIEENEGNGSGWSLDISTKIIRSTDKIKVIEYYLFSYQGGAHGSYNTHYQNIDPSNYSIIPLCSAITDTVELASIAEKYFIKTVNRKGMHYPDDFWFKENKFTLPKEYALAKEGLLLHYNIYEVGPYAQGDIEVLVPYQEVKHLLRIE